MDDGALRFSEAVLRAEAELKLVFDEAPVGMGLASLGGRHLRANQALCRLLGYREEELQQLTFTDLTHPDDRAPMPDGRRC